ncbi:MAG: hypothetical protein ABL921_18620 [Pirellula sp.]
MTIKPKRKKRPASSYVESIQKMTKEYFEITGNAKATTREIATWALQNNRWEPPSDLIIQCCRDDIARAMREEYITGPDGKPVRAKHAARVSEGDTQTTFWADIRTAPRRHMEIAFHQRREQIVGECRQLNRDAEYYNKNRQDVPPIQIYFDFNDDVEEGKFA